MRQIPFPDGSIREYPNGTMLWPIYPKKIILELVYGSALRGMLDD